jgi:hypothetical protein
VTRNLADILKCKYINTLMRIFERLKSGSRGWSPKRLRMREANVFHNSPTAVCGERAFGFWQSSDSVESAET